MAVEVAATDPTVLACIFFSYPLHPPGKEVWRASGSYHLADSAKPCPQLFFTEVVLSKELLVQSSSAVRTLLTALQ